MKFKVEIGSWEKGETMTIDATNKYDALDRARDFCEINAMELQRKYGDNDVVQMYNSKGRIIYDYMNGFELYERKTKD